MSDLHAHRVLAATASGAVRTVLDLDDRPSGIGFLPNGSPLVVSVRRRTVLRLGPGGAQLHADLSALGGEELNDMLVDAAGGAFVGCYHVTGAARLARDPAAAWPDTLLRVASDGVAAVAAEDQFSPNGMALSDDGRRLIVAQTYGHALLEFEVSEAGHLGHRRLFAERGTRHPDGICLDAEGAVWVACPRQSEFVRVARGGRVLDRISLPDTDWAVACLLGGPARRTLYLCIATTTLENQLRCQSFAAELSSQARGRVDVRDVEVTGAGRT